MILMKIITVLCYSAWIAFDWYGIGTIDYILLWMFMYELTKIILHMPIYGILYYIIHRCWSNMVLIVMMHFIMDLNNISNVIIIILQMKCINKVIEN